MAATASLAAQLEADLGTDGEQPNTVDPSAKPRTRPTRRPLRALLPLALAVAGVAGGSAGTAASVTTYRDEVLADNPVSYWRLGEAHGPTLVDELGANNGTYTATGVTYGQPGAIVNEPGNSAVAFDGTSGAASIQSSSSLSPTAGVTVETWVKRSKSGWQVLVAKPGNGQSKLEHYALWTNTSNYVVGYFGDGTNYVSVTSPTPLDTNWHLLDLTYDNATAKLYIDGTLKASVASTIKLTANTQPLSIGKTASNSFFFGGQEDDVAIYNYPLSATRIQTHWTKANTDLTAPVVTLATPAGGSSSSGTTPTFSGTAGVLTGDSATVTVKVYSGSSASGTPVQTLSATRGGGGAYSAAASPLADGTYTAQAEQADAAGNVGRSSANTFTVDTTAPTPTLTTPASGSLVTPAVSFSGSAGTAAGDSSTVTIKIYAGTSATGTPLQTPTASRQPDGSFSVGASPSLGDGTYTAQAEQTDAAGNVGRSSANVFTVDGTPPPIPVIGSGPSGLVSATTATFTFTDGDASAALLCRVDGAAFASCSSPASYSGIADGAHSFDVKARDPAGNESAAVTRSWTVDSTPPTVTVLSGPAALTTSSGATFTFSTSESGATLACSLDGADFTGCTSPQAYSQLADGQHTFGVRATDAAGNVGPASSVSWTVDTAAPAALITSKPSDPSSENGAVFAFTANEANVTFSCSLDGADFVACSSPNTYTLLSDGGHAFQVKATDAAGNTGAAASYSWTVQTAGGGGGGGGPDVTITAVPNNPTNSVSAGFGFTSQQGATFECSLDQGAFSACTSPQSFFALAEGVHTFGVRAVDADGTTGGVALYTWTVDLTPPPQPTIDSQPPSATSTTSASLGFSDTESGVTFACRLDNADFAACGSPKTYSGLADGQHTFQARARDAAGNESATASATWTVDTVGPTVTVTSRPQDPSNSSSATFAFSASEAGSTFACGLDGAGRSPCDSPQTFSGLADGSHTLDVVATDAVGNTGSVTQVAWTIDTVAPPPPSITASPPSLSQSANATFSFMDSEAGAGFRCRLDGGAFSACSSPQTYTGLADGAHTLDVQAVDAAGNASGSATASWTIDTTPPAVTLTSPPDGAATGSTTPGLEGGAGTDAGDSAYVTVKVYSGSSTAGTLLQTLTAIQTAGWWSVMPSTALTEGTYTAQAEQTDLAGNVGRSAPVTITIDTTPPRVTLATPAPGAATSERPTFSGTASTGVRDLATVNVKIYTGTTATGLAAQIVNAVVDPSGTYSVATTVPLAAGTYTAQAEQADQVENVGQSSAVTFTVSTTPYRDAVMADNPVGYWRLGETSGTSATDETRANPGTYQNGVALGAAGALGTEPSNTSASFDGINDDVTIASSSSLSPTAGVTVETWVKRSKSGWQVLVAKPGNAQSKLESYALWTNTSNYVVGYFGDGTNYVSITSPTVLDTNWHLLDLTYDNATAKLYIDGTLKVSVASTIRLTANTQPLNIGKTASNNNYFGGQQDDVAVYNTALSATRIAAHYNAAFDTTPPVVTVTAPAAGTLTDDTTPHLAGMAGTTSRDSSTVTVKLYAGSSATGTPIQTLTTTRYASGSWDVEAAAVSPGTYTTQAVQTDTVGNVGRSSAVTFTVGSFAASSDPVVVAAGDIAACNSPGAAATGQLLDQFPNATVISVGDNAYPAGTSSDFANCYDPYWGRAKSRTRPTLGPHDYGDVAHGSAAGYMAYFGDVLAQFGASATDENRAYYSFDLGTWHVVMVNTGCNDYARACDPNAQEQWLRADLAAHPTQCSLAVWHNPRFSSGGQHGSNVSEQRWWQAFYDYGGDVVLNGEDHIYERFAPQDANGFYAANAPREFIVGTGGAQHYLIGTVVSNSEIRNGDTFGLLQLRLHPNGYDWKFIPEAGKSFTDSGSGTCH